MFVFKITFFKGTSRERKQLFSLLGHYLANTTYAALFQIRNGFQYSKPIFEWKSRKLLAGSWKEFILEKNGNAAILPNKDSCCQFFLFFMS
jgi:hypothetical protein